MLYSSAGHTAGYQPLRCCCCWTILQGAQLVVYRVSMLAWCLGWKVGCACGVVG
jgi:hypothetical protein